MPSKKNARKHSTRKIDDEKALQASLFAKVDPKTWDTLTVVLKQFKVDGTGIYLEHNGLLTEFPVFIGKAPAGHPYPQAFKDGTDDEKWCYVETSNDLALLQDLETDLYCVRAIKSVLLRRKLPSGRVISIDTCEFALLNGGAGVAHINMDINDNHAANLKSVHEPEARKMLMDFTET